MFNKYLLNFPVRPLSVDILLNNQPLSADRTYDIECQAIGSKPTAKITWWMNGVQLRSFREKVCQPTFENHSNPNNCLSISTIDKLTVSNSLGFSEKCEHLCGNQSCEAILLNTKFQITALPIFNRQKHRPEYEWRRTAFVLDNNNINDGFSHSPQGSPSIVFNDTFCTLQMSDGIDVKQKSIYTSINLHHPQFMYCVYIS